MLKIGAVAIILGVIIFVIATLLHGGHAPHDLAVSLPQYAANRHWVAVHLSQFVGQFLVTLGLVALYRSIAGGPAAAPALLGVIAALVSISTYAVNQAVDGIAIKFVADQWVSASGAEKEAAFRVAQAVRHVEIGTTSLSLLLAGVAFVLVGLAVALSNVYPRWLGWGTGAVGVLWAAVGLGFAYGGFAPRAIALSIVAGMGQFVWALTAGALMWRRAEVAGPVLHRDRP